MTLDQEDLNKISGLIKTNIETSPFLITKFGRIDARLDGIDSRLDKVDSRLDKVDNRLDKVEGRLDKVENKLDRLEDKVDTLAEENKQDHEYFAQRLNEGFNHISKQLVQILNHEQRIGVLESIVMRIKTMLAIN